MKLLILSDLHLVRGEYSAPPPDWYDAVILAGDILGGEKAIRWAQQECVFGGRPVAFVAGNHEYYGGEFHRTRELMREAAAGSNVHFLDRDELILEGNDGERVRFLGATLWTDFAVYGDSEAAMNEARRGLNDFAGSIRWDSDLVQRRFMPEDSAAEHVRTRTWLIEQLADPSMDGLTTVVVTHHAPSRRSIAPQWQGHDLSPCFASDLPLSFFEIPQLWVHGHVHDSFNYRHGSARIVANPRGYRWSNGAYENGRFDPDLIIDTKSIDAVQAERPEGISEAEVLSKALRRVVRKLGLNANVVASAIGASAEQTTSVLVGRTTLDPHSEAGLRALKIVRLFAFLVALFGFNEEKRQAWMNGRIKSLDGVPVELIQTAEGLDTVLGYFESMKAR